MTSYNSPRDFMGYSVRISRNEREIVIVPQVDIVCKNCRENLDNIGIMHNRKWKAGYRKIIDRERKRIIYQLYPLRIDFYCIPCRNRIDMSDELNSICIVRFDSEEPKEKDTFPIFSYDAWNEHKPAMGSDGPAGLFPLCVDINEINPQDKNRCKWVGKLCPKGTEYFEKNRLVWKKRKQELVGKEIKSDCNLMEAFVHGPSLSEEQGINLLNDLRNSQPVIEHEEKKLIE